MSLFCYVLFFLFISLFDFVWIICRPVMRRGLIGEQGYQRTRMIQCWYNVALQFRMRWHDNFVIYLRALLFWV
ncbi:hypothetical protein V8C34DRAFT_110553 [Trichoderma compactum]